MESWLTVERERHEAHAREIARGAALPDWERAAEDVRVAMAWAGLSPGDRVLQLAAGDGRRTRKLLDAGLEVTPVEPSAPLAAAAEAHLDGAVAVVRADFDLWRPGGEFRAVLVLGGTLFTFWDVEELHRLRLRKSHAALAPGGCLVFGGPEHFGKPDLEWARIQQAYASCDAAPQELRRMHETGQFMHYQAAQARIVIEQCGFELLRIHNGFTEAQPYAHWEPGMVFVCRKKP